MKTEISIYGAGGHGKLVAEIAFQNGFNINYFIDDDSRLTEIFAIQIISWEIYKSKSATNHLFLAIGKNSTRKKISEKIPRKFEKIIDKSACISQTASIGEGTLIMPNAILNSGTIIGKHCIINSGSVVEHDCKIDDFVHISPNATITGNVQIGEGTHVGAAAVVLPNLTIGKWATIGAGAVILKDIPDFAVVVGNPGKIIKWNIENN